MVTAEQDSGRRGVALAAAGFVVLNYPVLRVLDHDGLTLGVPTPWLALFVTWAALLGLLAWVLRHA